MKELFVSQVENDPGMFTEAEVERLRLQCLLTELAEERDRIRDLIDRARYFSEPPTLEHLQEIHRELQRIIERFG